MLRDGGEMSALACALLFGASAATLIPSPLLEPRYFTVLLVMTRVHLAPASTRGGKWIGNGVVWSGDSAHTVGVCAQTNEEATMEN
jgi:hypothetical protein